MLVSDVEGSNARLDTARTKFANRSLPTTRASEATISSVGFRQHFDRVPFHLQHTREDQLGDAFAVLDLLWRAIQINERDSNLAAQRLYAGFGFRPVGRRRRYYRAPVEDAVLLQAVISAGTQSA